eukprot:TRINITY_DN3376_c2_g1_i1.p1 TRINITY_DN3376_c2_g1~~TRINITY_DN3376_c2_g1_i1.p1  ORF type:complete len:292 (+),score=47.96 TRINITY_DN3376_c2_g1_i1:590-1465(+)
MSGLSSTPAVQRTRRIRRARTPEKKMNLNEVPKPLDADVIQSMTSMDLLNFEKTRLQAELELQREGTLGDNTPAGPPPPRLLPQRPPPMPISSSANEVVVKRPSVLVGPIPAKSETKGSNLPLILAKALGETLGVRVGPTLIVGQEARIDVPSYGIEEKALKKEFFVCLGKKIKIHKNDKIHSTETFLASRLDSLRQRVNSGYNLKRERSEEREERRGKGGGRRGGRGRSGSPRREVPEATPIVRAPPTPPEGYSCNRCSQSGHWIRDCPYIKNNIKTEKSAPVTESTRMD